MGALEQVMDLKNKGASENDIISKLRENGVSPMDINEALNQARIKSAVSSEKAQEDSSGQEGMEPSMMTSETPEGEAQEVGNEDLPTENISDENLMPPEPSPQGYYSQRGSPATKEIGEQKENSQSYEGEYSPSAQYPGYAGTAWPQENSYPSEGQQSYSNYDDGNYAGPMQSVGDADTMIEIAEQVFFEKIKSLQKQVESFNEFRTLSQVKLDNISERLRRIETHMDRLQAEILEKVGSYGRGIDSVKKEMSMMQDSFGKVVNTLVDGSEKTRSHPHQTHHSTSSSHSAHSSHTNNSPDHSSHTHSPAHSTSREHKHQTNQTSASHHPAPHKEEHKAHSTSKKASKKTTKKKSSRKK